MIDRITKWWQGHGTKILGVLTTLVGIGGETLTYLQALDPKHSALWAFIIALGGSIVKRGFTNSARLATMPAPDPTAVVKP